MTVFFKMHLLSHPYQQCVSFVRTACYLPQEKQNQPNEAEHGWAVQGCLGWGGESLVFPPQLQSDNKISEPFCFRKKTDSHFLGSRTFLSVGKEWVACDWTAAIAGIRKARLYPVLKDMELIKNPAWLCHLFQPAGLSQQLHSAKQLDVCRDMRRWGLDGVKLDRHLRLRTLVKLVCLQLLRVTSHAGTFWCY